MAERIVGERMPVDSLLAILKPQEEIFPSEPKAIQIVKSDPTLSHNFAYFSLTLLALLGFFVLDPRRGTFELRMVGPIFKPSRSTSPSNGRSKRDHSPQRGNNKEPASSTQLETSRQEKDCVREAFRLLKRILLSMAHLGFKPHVLEISNLLNGSSLNQTMPSVSVAALKGIFKSWEVTHLYAVWEQDSHYQENAFLEPRPTEQLPEKHRLSKRVQEIILTAKKDQYRLRICKHGILVVPGRDETGQVVFTCIYREQDKNCGVVDLSGDVKIAPTSLQF